MVRLYVAIGEGLAVVSLQSGGWRIERNLDGQATRCIAADPLRPEQLYCGTFGERLWSSTDAGVSLEPIEDGIPYAEVMGDAS
jgi:hypothetical protein